MPDNAARTFVHLMALLGSPRVKGPLLYVTNVVLSAYSRKFTMNDFIRLASEQPGFGRYYTKDGWVQYPGAYYEYDGASQRSGTKMGTIVLLRK